ncbi:hypothetical protein GCM10009702_01550 [Propioniferax innocua]
MPLRASTLTHERVLASREGNHVRRCSIATVVAVAIALATVRRRFVTDARVRADSAGGRDRPWAVTRDVDMGGILDGIDPQ